jgi:hypothetical protein
MSVIVITVVATAVLFGLAATALSLKVIFKRRTPLKAHACDVMCIHGHNRVCACDPAEHHEDCAR